MLGRSEERELEGGLAAVGKDLQIISSEKGDQLRLAAPASC